VTFKGRKQLVLGASVLALAVPVAACGSDNSDKGDSSSSSSSKKKTGSVAVLLPDSKSSTRWETVDRPFLKKAFDAAGVKSTITNAEGDKSAQQQQAEQAITNGAKVLLLVNLDSGSGAAIAANAKSQGVKVIDYDRLTLKGDSDYYVSFDNEKVGKLQGQGLVDCLGKTNGQSIATLNGSPTDNNATLFAKGYNSVVTPLYKDGKLKKAADQSVPDWDNQKALTIFEQMLQKTSNKIDGVLAANDGLGNAAISALKQRKLPQIPVTGQDATLEGLQNILNGDQCMTVYKAIKKETDAAALGIEVVYQDLALADNLDVVQNMYLGREELGTLRRLDETAMEKRASETLKGLSVTTIRSVRQTVAGLSGGQRQSVAVAKAVMWNSRVVILDEPTAALGVAQTKQVLDLVARLGEQGLAVVLISHNLHDIFQVADTITVLRLGQNVKEFKRRETNQQEVVEAITAGQLSHVPGQSEEAVA
jgi:D-xylose transport system substrate-binding protein